MTKPTQIIEKAQSLGYETAAELAAFINGHEIGNLTGVRNTLEEVTSRIKESAKIETDPEQIRDETVKDTELDFLTYPNWKPSSTIHHTSRED